jgi:hypothetical protein
MISGSPRLLHDGAALHHAMQQPWRYCICFLRLPAVKLQVRKLPGIVYANPGKK